MDFKCRFCGNQLVHTFVDLGAMPLSNGFLKVNDLKKMEPFYPLHAYVCDNCFLVQLPAFHTPEEIFEEYAYFSSFSSSWIEHVKNYVDNIIPKLKLNRDSTVVEIASNDGYLLRFFKEKGIPILGIEPAKNVAEVAKKKGIPTIVDFFGTSLAKDLKKKNISGDLIIANNVLAHVPDINDFVQGLKVLLSSSGVVTAEFPHLLSLIENNQFDTIYHEHFSYFSFYTIQKIFKSHGLKIFDVEKISTHGGSLRIYASHEEDSLKIISDRVRNLYESEKNVGIDHLDLYSKFKTKVEISKRKILELMIKIKKENAHLVGYGAPAKGNILLNYCGIRRDFIDYTVDKNPYKQGCFLPGTHIPIYSPEKIKETRPDYVIIMPWNIQDEIIKDMGFIKQWGGKFVVLIPEPRILL